MKDELKRWLEVAEDRAHMNCVGPEDIRFLCKALRDSDAENERLRALVKDLIAIDERGTLGNLATRQHAFVELGDIIVKARDLLGPDPSEQPVPGTLGETVIASGTATPSDAENERLRRRLEKAEAICSSVGFDVGSPDWLDG